MHWLLLSLLLAVQGLAHAHEYTHLDEPETTICSVCNVNGSPAHNAPLNEPPALENQSDHSVLESGSGVIKNRFHVTPGPRAPPSYS